MRSVVDGSFYYVLRDADTLALLTPDDIPADAALCCDCGCGGSSDISTVDFSVLQAFDNNDAATVATGKAYLLSDNNTYGLPQNTLMIKY